MLPVAGFCIVAALTPFSALADTDLDIGGTGVVAYANGDSVRIRVGPGPDESVAGEVAEGSAVYIIDGLYTAADGSLWYQVESNGISGFMVADYLAREGAAPASVGGSAGDAVATEQVYVRTGPSTADGILGNLEAGDVVTLTGNTSNGFYEIWYGDYVGYAYADFISPGGAATAAVAAPAEPEAETPEVSPTGAVGTYYTTDSVNLRAGASTGDGVVEVVPAGTEVSLIGYVANGFSEVTSAYGGGWISSDYLSANAPAAPAAPEASSAGQSIVNFAMQFQGYPYVWAGNTPSGFDCSGFTQYVVQNTLGIDITHGTELQMSYGSSVGWGDWQPGDLIFFTGTYEGGWITHVGIYIGDGMMIHAENPGTGVVISDITSGYYADHYYGATRVG
jgi:cell wall-associated NlpC family hydrolase